MVTPAAVILTYCLMGLTGVSIGYLYLRDVFGPSRHPVFYVAFFIVRFCYDALVYYWPAAHGKGLVPTELLTPLTYVWSIASFSCIIWIFDGSKLEVLLVSFFTNMVSSVETACAMTVANLLVRGSIEQGYWVPFDAGVLLAMALSMAECFLLRRPTEQLSRLVQAVSKRNGTFLLSCAMAAFVAYITVAVGRIVYMPFSAVSRMIIGISLLTMVPLAVSLHMDSRELRTRTMLVSEFNDMLQSYDAQVHEKLALLERDHDLFAGVGGALSRLDVGRVTSEQRERVARLERSYQALAQGTYCDNPALDAVLVAYGDRLRGLGVVPSLSVAGVGMDDLDTAFVALVLLDFAHLAARQARDVEGERVTFRLRAMDETVLCHLDMPASWRPLGPVRHAGRTLSHEIDCVEHVEGDRRLVLAMRGGALA